MEEVLVKNDGEYFKCPNCGMGWRFAWPPTWPLTTRPVTINCKGCGIQFTVRQEVEDAMPEAQ